MAIIAGLATFLLAAREHGAGLAQAAAGVFLTVVGLNGLYSLRFNELNEQIDELKKSIEELKRNRD